MLLLAIGVRSSSLDARPARCTRSSRGSGAATTVAPSAAAETPVKRHRDVLLALAASCSAGRSPPPCSSSGLPRHTEANMPTPWSSSPAAAGRGSRGLALVRSGVAPVLVVSDAGRRPGRRRTASARAGRRRSRSSASTPTRTATRGEAEASPAWPHAAAGIGGRRQLPLPPGPRADALRALLRRHGLDRGRARQRSSTAARRPDRDREAGLRATRAQTAAAERSAAATDLCGRGPMPLSAAERGRHPESHRARPWGNRERSPGV